MEFSTQLYSLVCICLKISIIKRKKEKKHLADSRFCQLEETLGSQETLRKGAARSLPVAFGSFHITKECVHFLFVSIYRLSSLLKCELPKGMICFVHWLSRVPITVPGAK